MTEMKDVFFSTTHGSEALSIAAALATVRKIQREPVIEKLYSLGVELQEKIYKLIEKHSIESFVRQFGHSAWSFLNIDDYGDIRSAEIKTYWLQECLSYGILCLGTHNLNYLHTRYDIQKLLDVYDRVFSNMAEAVFSQSISSRLKCGPLKPAFRVG